MPGGADALVGNNPLAVGLPCADSMPVDLDMAMSEAAMGKIRLAGRKGGTIPVDWALDATGNATTDPAEALKGVLLHTAGPKCFGLALVIDLLCGTLSG